MMTLKELINQAVTVNTAMTERKILECGATRVAMDASGAVFAYKGETTNERYPNEWGSGNKSGEKAVLFLADLPEPDNWKECVWVLP
jgi:hypothetical protein